ncbi:hypothetical protein V2J09_008119 [Rumex salicifolius]
MPSSPAMSESVAKQTEFSLLKRNTIRETVEKLHSQSTDLMQLAVQWKDLGIRFDSIQTSIDDRVCDLDKKELHLEWKSKYLKQKCREIESKLVEIKLTETELEDEKKELDDLCLEADQTYQLVSMCHARAEETARSWEEKLRLLKLKKRRLVPKEKRLMVKQKMLKRKYGVLKNWSEELVSRENRLYDFVAELKFREKNLKKIQEIEPRERRLEEMESELKRKETRFSERYKGEEVDDADIRFYITMNGRDLIGFLNSHADDLEIMRDEVTRALRLSSNPAKLVLDAIQEFYGGNLEENSDLSIVRRSCIVLLEQLSELEPQIAIKERERARLLAVEWKERMKADNYHNLELVGAFRLTNDFDKDELAKFIGTAAHHAWAPALCSRLGLEDKADSSIFDFTNATSSTLGFEKWQNFQKDIVLHLIQDMRAVEAVRFVHEFNLMDTIPPAPILRNYLESVVFAADNISTADLTKKQATDMIVAALISVIKCIKDFNLDSECPTGSLEDQVLDLQRLRECFSSSEEPENVVDARVPFIQNV